MLQQYKCTLACIGIQMNRHVRALDGRAREVAIKSALDFTERFHSGEDKGCCANAGCRFFAIEHGNPWTAAECLRWDGEKECHPAFVNEAAYYSKGTAFQAKSRGVHRMPTVRKEGHACIAYQPYHEKGKACPAFASKCQICSILPEHEHLYI